MTSIPDLSDLISLSLLPPWTWRDAAERLRAGAPPAIVLTELLDRRGRDSRNARRSTGARRRRSVARSTAASRRCPGATLRIRRRSRRSSIRRSCSGRAARRLRSNVRRWPWSARARRRPHGLAVAERLAADLAARGIVVVSGLARGVDSAAHRGALAGGGSTIAVLGSGADVIYPPEHAALAREIEAAGVVMSELVPGTPPLPQFFPLRNRIISGPVARRRRHRGGEKSGSLITARWALEQGRDVLAVPGNVLSGRNRGAHALLRDGAKIVEAADDILEELGLPDGRARRAMGEGHGPFGPDAGVSDAGRTGRSRRDCRAIRRRAGAPAAAVVRAGIEGPGGAGRRRPIRTS